VLSYISQTLTKYDTTLGLLKLMF